MSMPGVNKYNRLPTRGKIQFMWAGVFVIGAGLQLARLTVMRVNSKREEELYQILKDKYGENIPERILKEARALREMRETLSLQNALDSPTPGEVSAALMDDMDPRRIAKLRDRTW